MGGFGCVGVFFLDEAETVKMVECVFGVVMCSENGE